MGGGGFEVVEYNNISNIEKKLGGMVCNGLSDPQKCRGPEAEDAEPLFEHHGFWETNNQHRSLSVWPYYEPTPIHDRKRDHTWIYKIMAGKGIGCLAEAMGALRVSARVSGKSPSRGIRNLTFL